MQMHLKDVLLNRSALALLFISVMSFCSSCSEVPVEQPSRKPAGSQPIFICDLLKNVQLYRGKMVTVTGIYWRGLRQTCTEPFSTGGHEWPSAIFFVGSDFVAGTDESVAFETDERSWEDLDEIVIREAKAGRREEIWATMTGKLLAPESYLRKDGRVVGGYGPLGVFPAQLVVERIVDVEIKPNPTYEYREMLRRNR